MKAPFTDAIYVFDGLAWLRWLTAMVFCLLGLWAGRWQALRSARKRHRREELSAPLESTAKRLDRSEFGPIFSSKPDNFDDLQRIKGIGKALRAKLYNLGIYRFQQIADWGEPEVAAVSKKLHLVDQIDKNEWISQAKRLGD